MTISSTDRVDERIISEIRRSIDDTAGRGLTIASKCLLRRSSELLMSIPASKRKNTKNADTSSSSMRDPDDVFDDSDNDSKWLTSGDREAEERDADVIDAARRCMAGRQYHRAVHLLRECWSSKARFLAVYCRFLISEKKALAEWHKLDGTRHQPPVPVNTTIGDLLETVERSDDPWLQFLEGLFLTRLSRIPEALQALYDSISLYPWNWSAWLLLGSCLESVANLTDALVNIDLPIDHPLSQLFQIKIMNELHSSTEVELKLCEKLLGVDYFPGNLWLMGQRGRTLYDLLDLQKAEEQFEAMLKLDPNRIDDMDVYSNILYTRLKKERLANLAENFLAQNKNRPEICCIIGNYYSLRAEHEKAAKYFRRATHLDRTSVQAWTLMGSGYSEMGNAPAAIESYRRALDINKKDYRPWLGLGQVYNMLNLYHYSIHYFQQAARLRPAEYSIWDGLETAFNSIGSIADAYACSQRAITHQPLEMSLERRVELQTKAATKYRELMSNDEWIEARFRILKLWDREARFDPERKDPFPAGYLDHLVDITVHHAHAPNGNLKLAKDYIQLYTAYDSPAQSATAATLASLMPEVLVKGMSKGCQLTDKDAPLHGFSMEHRAGGTLLETYLKQNGVEIEL